MNIKRLEKHKLFALDALGAVISIVYLFIVYRFDELFGMPKGVVILFIIIAIILALYSSIMYIMKPTNWPMYLTIIAILNYFYCLYTIYHIILNHANLTIFGYTYFIIEIIVIVVLATYELRVSRKATNA